MEAMKKSYHSACKEEKLAVSREANSKIENNNPETQKKLQEKVEKCQQEVQKVRLSFEKTTRWGQGKLFSLIYEGVICNDPTEGSIF